MTNSFSERFGERAELTMPAVREEFPRLRTFLEKWTARIRLPEHTTMQLLIAADEIFSNIAAYAYTPEQGDVEIRAACDLAARSVTLTFIDRGVSMDPLSLPDPDVTAAAAERRIGGLGIFVVKKLMDKVEYRREDGRNVLTLTKFFGDKGDPSCG